MRPLSVNIPGRGKRAIITVLRLNWCCSLRSHIVLNLGRKKVKQRWLQGTFLFPNSQSFREATKKVWENEINLSAQHQFFGDYSYRMTLLNPHVSTRCTFKGANGILEESEEMHCRWSYDKLLPHYRDLNHNWVFLQWCVHLVWLTASLLLEDRYVLLLLPQSFAVHFMSDLSKASSLFAVIIIIFLISGRFHSIKSKDNEQFHSKWTEIIIVRCIIFIISTVRFSGCGSCVKSNASIHVCTLRHVHYASLLLCALSPFQRACFCAGTDDAAGRSMTVAGSTSALAHLQKTLAPGSHFI